MNPAILAPARGEIGLTWRSNDAMRRLAYAFSISLGVALASGVLLLAGLSNDNLNHVLLLAHLASSVLALVFFFAFVVWHWRDCREPLLNLIFPLRLLARRQQDVYAMKRLQGYALMWVMLAVLLSGAAIALPAILYLAGSPQTLPYGSHVWLLDLHRWGTLALLLALAKHFPLREKAR